MNNEHPDCFQQLPQPFDYIEEASLTLSNKFHGEKVTMAAARQIFDDFIRAGQRLDALKKALFYGKGEDIGPTLALGIELATAAPYRMVAVPDVITSQDEATKFKKAAAKAEVILHCLVGIATESVEGIEALYKAIWGDQPIDRINVLEESGDGFWYHANLFKVLDTTFDIEQRRNIAKLRLRFPDNFTEYDAINRNTDAEREVLEGEPMHYEATVSFGRKLLIDDPELGFVAPSLAEQYPDAPAKIASGDLTLNEEGNRLIETHSLAPQRFATRCPSCGLSNGQHYATCPVDIF